MTSRQEFDSTEAKCRECDARFAVPAIAACPACGSRYLSTPRDLANEDRVASIENAVAVLRAEADRLQAVADAMYRVDVLAVRS